MKTVSSGSTASSTHGLHECGFFRPIVKEVIERYLDCGNPRCGFARIRCPDCRDERLLMFSCRTRGFCLSYHAKRIEEWDESRDEPGADQDEAGGLRVGKYMIRPLLALERLTFLEPEGKVGYRWGRDGTEQETMDYPEFIARVTSHIPDKGQVLVRYHGLYANAHRGKVKKASLSPSALRMVEEELRRLPSKGWAEMIRKVYEVDPMACPDSEAS